MVRVLSALSVLTALAAAGDVVLQPTRSSGPERLLIFVPGAGVDTEFYRATGEAIQEAASEVRLTVVVPSVLGDLCIAQCPSSGTCLVLKQTIDAAVKKSGFPGTNPREDTFVAGHSMGSVCANNLVKGYHYEYAGLIALGGYVDRTGESSVANYAIPVLHLSGEMDGGGARPGKLSLFYQQFKEYSSAHGSEEALTLKPVHVLPGVDHSDFCPGFFVTAIEDLRSEVTQEEALKSIGSGIGAFLHLNSPTSDAAKAGAMSTMKSMLQFTEEMCEPYLKAYEMEAMGSLCGDAQQVVSGLSSDDLGRLKIEIEVVDAGEFEHAHTNYSMSGSDLNVRIESTFEASGGFGPNDIHGASKSVDCKMQSSARIAEQLKVTAQSVVECGALTDKVVSIAQQLLPKKSLERWQAKGRKVCTETDKTVLWNTGPLFIETDIDLTEATDCLQVSSLSLETKLSSMLYPGVRYCKLLSPSMAMEWMMTDGLKPFPYDLEGSAVDVLV